MLRTVTAGGFFSLGGMTAVDVHGGTVNEPIFAETVSAFNLVLADGTSLKIDRQLQAADGWHPLQFARVSLGELEIVTSMTIDVLPRPYASTLYGDSEHFRVRERTSLRCAVPALVGEPCAARDVLYTLRNKFHEIPLYPKNFLVLWWDIVDHPATKPSTVLQPLIHRRHVRLRPRQNRSTAPPTWVQLLKACLSLWLAMRNMR